MTTRAQILGLGEFARWGFTLEHPDDHSVELSHQGHPVARFSQAGASEDNIQAECARHLATKHGWDGCLWSGRGDKGNHTRNSARRPRTTHDK